MSAASDKIHPPRGFNQLPLAKKKERVIKEVDLGNRDPWVYKQAKALGVEVPKTLSDVIRAYFYKHKLMFYRNKMSRSLVACDDMNNLTENVEPNLACVFDDVVDAVIEKYKEQLSLNPDAAKEETQKFFRHSYE